VLIALVVVVEMFSSGEARAESFERARQLYFDANIEPAAEAFREVLEGDHLTTREVAVAHVHLAALEMMLGNEQEARVNLRVALAIDETIEVAEGAPMQMQELRREALNELRGAPPQLALDADGELEPGAEITIRASLDPAPEQLVAAIELSCVAGDAVLGQVTGEPPSVSLEVEVPDSTMSCDAVALHYGGSVLMRADTELSLFPEDDEVNETDERNEDVTEGDEEPIDRRRRRRIGISVGVVLSVVVVASAAALGVVLSDRRASFQETRVVEW
jgi:hypothetical protein